MMSFTRNLRDWRYATVKVIPRTLVLLIIASFIGYAPAGLAIEPTWAKGATAFPEQCASYYPDKAIPCKPTRVVAPDGKSSVQVFYSRKTFSRADLGGYGWVLQAHLRVIVSGKQTGEMTLPLSYQNVDLLWSPDSEVFFVDGDGDGAPVAGSWVRVYVADHPTNPIDVTESARRDMLKQFPASEAAFPNGDDPTGCEREDRGQVSTPADDINVSAVAWVTSSSILIVAEVPCDSNRGGIMCQVMGYELRVPEGRILKRISARDLKREWQKSMAWDFRIPDPPRYCSTSDSPSSGRGPGYQTRVRAACCQFPRRATAGKRESGLREILRKAAQPGNRLCCGCSGHGCAAVAKGEEGDIVEAGCGAGEAAQVFDTGGDEGGCAG